MEEDNSRLCLLAQCSEYSKLSINNTPYYYYILQKTEGMWNLVLTEESIFRALRPENVFLSPEVPIPGAVWLGPSPLWGGSLSCTLHPCVPFAL